MVDGGSPQERSTPGCPRTRGGMLEVLVSLLLGEESPCLAWTLAGLGDTWHPKLMSLLLPWAPPAPLPRAARLL